MFLNDFRFIIVWWLIFLVLGIINLPLTLILFKRFFDRGYIFAKVFGMAFFSYTIWVLGSLHIIPFGVLSILFAFIVSITINAIILNKTRKDILVNIPWTFIVLEEGFFFVGLFFWSYVRATAPDIRGLEKFMDYGFMESVLRTKYFPPADMWLSPSSINYYYFGHALTAFLTYLSGIASEITYNLMLATLFAFTFTGAFSITANLFSYFYEKTLLENKEKERIPGADKKIRLTFSLFSGTIAGLLMSLGGNLHTIVYVLKNGVDKYWYPDATRYIPYTIHEFPIYSFVVSDLHGHVLDIPNVLLILALILAYLISRQFIILPVLGFILGISFMTNAWDLPIYLMVLGGTLLYLFSYPHAPTFQSLKKAAGNSLLVFIVAILVSLPFNLGFKQIAQGIAPVFAHSPLYMLLVLWGFPLLMTITFLLFLFPGRISHFFRAETLVKGMASFFGLQIQVVKEKTKSFTSHFAFPDGYILILLAVSFLLIIFPEIFYIKDIYIKEYHRANTMFKFVYQSFMMFCIAIGYITARMLYSFRTGNQKAQGLGERIWFLLFAIGFSSVMIYPYFAINSYYGGLKTYHGLDGISWVKTQYPSDYAAILWMRKNISGQPTILEAVGESYTDYSIFSAYTGIPTVLGWPVHEWLWRGSYDEPGKRTADIQKIYESISVSEAGDLLRKYKVAYVIVNAQARAKYKNLNETSFKELGNVVFQDGETHIYKIINN